MSELGRISPHALFTFILVLNNILDVFCGSLQPLVTMLI
jgi:hypothetical protein